MIAKKFWSSISVKFQASWNSHFYDFTEGIYEIKWQQHNLDIWYLDKMLQ